MGKKKKTEAASKTTEVSGIEVHITTKQLDVPWSEEEAEAILEEMKVNQIYANELIVKIKPYKEKIKTAQALSDRAREKWIEGKTASVEVEETYDNNTGKMYSKRLDTGEELPVRDIEHGEPVTMELETQYNDDNTEDDLPFTSEHEIEMV